MGRAVEEYSQKENLTKSGRFNDMGVRTEWLVYNGSANIMKCNICQRYSASHSCSFVVGTMQLQSVIDHERSKAHISATQISTAAA